jgi:DNA mismatch repair protein MutS
MTAWRWPMRSPATLPGRTAATRCSFGLQVAALAGLPRATVAQARRRLAELEQRGSETQSAAVTPQALDAPQQFGLFTAPNTAALDALAAVDPDELTPRQALEALYRLKALL